MLQSHHARSRLGGTHDGFQDFIAISGEMYAKKRKSMKNRNETKPKCKKWESDYKEGNIAASINHLFRKIALYTFHTLKSVSKPYVCPP